MEDLFVNDAAVADNDPVLTEMPIYLNTERQPMILQYPTRKLTERAMGQTATTLRVKPTPAIVQVDIASDMPYEYTDADRKSRWNELNYQTFGGMMKPAGDRYAVGQIVDNELILTRVQKTAQLRPQFEHFNQQTKDEKDRLMVKDDRPTVMRSVQVSAKSSNEAVSRYSEVIDYYKNAGQEEFKTHFVSPPTEDQLSALSRGVQVKTDDLPDQSMDITEG